MVLTRVVVTIFARVDGWILSLSMLRISRFGKRFTMLRSVSSALPIERPASKVSPVSDRQVRLELPNQDMSSFSRGTLAKGKGEIDSCSILLDLKDGRISASKLGLLRGSLVLIVSLFTPSRAWDVARS